MSFICRRWLRETFIPGNPMRQPISARNVNAEMGEILICDRDGSRSQVASVKQESSAEEKEHSVNPDDEYLCLGVISAA